MLALLKATSALAGASVDRTVAMARVLTGSDGPALIECGHSGLNHDGSPLQLCISFDGAAARYRLLGDPASDVSDIGRRFDRSLIAKKELLRLADAESLGPVLDRTLECLVGTQTRFESAKHPDGVMWLAGELEGRGVAMYVDARDGGVDPAARLHDWLGTVARRSPDADLLVEAVSMGRVMSAGIEGVSPKFARAKIYWRLAKPAPLGTSSIDLFSHPAFARFTIDVLGEREVSLDAIVLSAGLALPSATLADAKLDICCCPRCASLDADATLALATRLAAMQSATLPDIRPLIDVSDLAFVGFALTRDLEARVNLYFKPKLEVSDNG
ncbi:MAG: hypothetical protein QOG83_273 [Alphaproteobacteria bacterium]|jgi:hypothetical protein|nr:hypothetical protein [Alphaproteobacteria bacterium]